MENAVTNANADLEKKKKEVSIRKESLTVRWHKFERKQQQVSVAIVATIYMTRLGWT